MTPTEITLVQDSFAKVKPIAEDAAKLFYAKLFELDGDLKPLFKGDMAEQGRKLMGMINTVVNSLDNLDSIVPAVQKLGRGHVAYGVEDSHYDTVAAALLDTLEKGLGDGFTSDVKSAWISAYTILSDTMKAAAGEERAATA